MNRNRLFPLLCALLVLLSSCAMIKNGEKVPPGSSYRIYYAVGGDSSATRTVDFEYHTLPPGADPAGALVQLVLSAPGSGALFSPAPAGTRLLSSSLQKNGQLLLDFSEQYGGLSGVDLTVANACLALTLCQLEGVESVSITVEGVSIPYQTLRALGENDLLLPGAEEGSITVTAPLYFPAASGSALSVEYRDVVKAENGTLAGAVLSALLEGPRYQSMRSLLPEGAELRSVLVEDSVCYVNFSGEFLSAAPQDGAEARLLLYSIVDTMCAQEGLGINSVQFLIEGEPTEFYSGISVSAPLQADFTLARGA